MKVTRCDKCGRDIDPGRVISPDDVHDLCEECAMEILRNYFKVPCVTVPVDKTVSRNADPEGEQTASEEYDSIMKKIREEEKAERDAKYEEILESASAGSKKKKGTEERKKERKKAPEPTPEDSRLFDQGKAQALRNAGWPIKKIAEEMRCCPATVYNNTYPPVEKKKQDLEFVDDDIARLGETDISLVREDMET